MASISVNCICKIQYVDTEERGRTYSPAAATGLLFFKPEVFWNANPRSGISPQLRLDSPRLHQELRVFSMAACAAANRAIGTRKGEQLT